MILTERKAVRVPWLPADQWDDAVDRARGDARTAQPGTRARFSEPVNHPDLTEFLRFNVHLLFNSTLPPRLRELAILRVAHRTDSAYEWMQHVKMGLREGLTEDDIAGVQRGEAADAFDRTVLTAVRTAESPDCPMRRGPRWVSASTNDSGWTWCSRSAATSPCQWL
jgi:alkylhydroperoxidase/carboxymuconolactone decarboxylase family protein YurZ